MTPQQWLHSERDYEAGRCIYEALGPNAILKRTLSSGPNSYNCEALAYELGKLAKAGVATAVVLPQPPTPAPEPSPNATNSLQSEPVQPEKGAELLVVLKEHVQALYDKRRYLHAQLEHVDESTRLSFALDIQGLSRGINEHWKTVAYVKEHGCMPNPEPTAPVFDVNTGTLAELKDLRANLRCNISKWKKKPARAADLARAQEQEKALTARIEVLKGEEGARG
ncbi:hypothetical protein [Hymenobacter sp. BT491]|uniref:hypothetical protein n=1 Tax=Hymenobacter sp. BT491 TaxID=2766779 RepID=UPI001653C551|nr:hypothetical protein [Hymenobacter sp. BT491]MBC6988563.1 hypothetical protein [Hymenobacter sp. BT491]